MAQVFKSSFKIGDETGEITMNQEIQNYWGDELLEKIFPIPLWKLKQLFNAFPSSDVALKVTDIEVRLLVDANWVAFDESLETVLENDMVQPNDYYFVLSEADFGKLRNGGTNIDDKLFMFIGRIGKSTDENNSDTYFGYFCIADTLIKGPVVAGDGASTGFKVPNP